MTDVTPGMIAAWRTNYGLDVRTPEEAMRWWSDHNIGQAPAGAVAALGLCLEEIARLTQRVGRDVSDFDYPPGSAPCMCFFSTAEDSGPDPLGECDYHRPLRARLAEAERTIARLSGFRP